MAPVLMPALLSGLTGHIVGLEQPGIPTSSASFEAKGSVGGLARVPLKSGAPGSSHEAFCPYCGIINENADTAFSHVRKHLDLLFVCGACHAKRYVNGQALQRHMTYQCISAMAILDKPKSSRR